MRGHLRLAREPVQQLAGVGDLVVRIVERDLSRAVAEAARRVGEHGEPAPGQFTGLLVGVGLASEEAVRDQDRARITTFDD